MGVFGVIVIIVGVVCCLWKWHDQCYVFSCTLLCFSQCTFRVVIPSMAVCVSVMCLAVLFYVSVSVPSGWLFHPWQSASVLCVQLYSPMFQLVYLQGGYSIHDSLRQCYVFSCTLLCFSQCTFRVVIPSMTVCVSVMCLAVLFYVSVSVPSGWLFHPWQSASVLCVQLYSPMFQLVYLQGGYSIHDSLRQCYVFSCTLLCFSQCTFRVVIPSMTVCVSVMCLAVLSYVSVSVPSGWLFHPWQSASVLCVQLYSPMFQLVYLQGGYSIHGSLRQCYVFSCTLLCFSQCTFRVVIPSMTVCVSVMCLAVLSYVSVSVPSGWLFHP